MYTHIMTTMIIYYIYIQCIPTFREGRSDLLRESIPALVLDILHSLAMAIIQCGPTKG